MRLVVDMNLTPRWVQRLSAAGHIAEHWSSVGPVTATDHLICDYARKHDSTLITNDLDFPQILAHTAAAKPSVILLRGEPLIPELRGDAVLRAIEGCLAELNDGAVLTIDWSNKPRVRLLPLR